MVYEPSAIVLLATDVPFTLTVTKSTGLPSAADVTVPLTFFCAFAEKAQKITTT
jgi:hypothetical protein